MARESDPFNLARFLVAQAPAIECAYSELRAGKKSGHWMWFIFPQILGLGRSPMSEKYAIQSLTEARTYLAHPLLGGRLRNCVGLVIESGKPIQQIFGYPDWLKFRSSVTLFSAAAPNETILTQAIERCCAGVRDAATLEILSGKGQTPHLAPPRGA